MFKEQINLNKNQHIMTNLPFGLLGSKSRVLHLERTPSPVPSIQMYSSMTFVSRGRVMYRSRTFLSVAAVCNDILETWILRNNNIMTLQWVVYSPNSLIALAFSPNKLLVSYIISEFDVTCLMIEFSVLVGTFLLVRVTKAASITALSCCLLVHHFLTVSKCTTPWPSKYNEDFP